MLKVLFKFLRRLWNTVYNHVQVGLPKAGLQQVTFNSEQKAIRRKLHETLKKVSDDLERRFTFNTAIASNMELLNALNQFKVESDLDKMIRHEVLSFSLIMLSPIIPHICHELWHCLGYDNAIVDQSWPPVDESALEKDAENIVVQVNGKLRANIEVPVNSSKEDIEKLALSNPVCQKYIADKTIKKVIVVPGKLINIVVSG